MLSAPKLLSECSPIHVIDDTPGEQYQIQIESGDYLLLEVGTLANTPASKFTHPNLSLTQKRIYEFKHYMRYGKKWTSKAGISHFFVVPRNQITVLPYKGYSYIHVMINGVQITLSVSGSTQNGWTDLLHTTVHTSVGYSLSILKKIAQVSVKMEIPPKPDTYFTEQRWNELASQINAGAIIKRMSAMLRQNPDNPPVVHFKNGCSFDGETVVKYDGTSRQAILVRVYPYSCCKAKRSQVNWLATAKANNL